MRSWSRKSPLGGLGAPLVRLDPTMFDDTNSDFALSVAALVVTVIFGGGAFSYGQLLGVRDTIENRNDGLRETILERTEQARETIESGDDELRDAMGSRWTLVIRTRILERIEST